MTNSQKKILAGLNYTGVDKLFQQFDNALGMILTFHHVTPQEEGKFAPNAHLSIHPDFLDAVIRLLRRRGVDIISIDELPRRISRPDRSGRFAVLTFDDGYRDNLEYALPILREHEAPFTLYLATGLIEGGVGMWWRGIEALVRQQDHFLAPMDYGPDEIACSSIAKKYAAYSTLTEYLTKVVPETDLQQKLKELCWLYKIDLERQRADALMTWNEIAVMAAEPLCTIGAHTVDHPILARLDAKLARNEMDQGRTVLEMETGTKPVHFAYPYGTRWAAGPREFEIAKKLRFRTAVTTRPGMIYDAHAEHMTALPRISVNGLFQRMRYFAPLTTGLPTRIANGFRSVNVSA